MSTWKVGLLVLLIAGIAGLWKFRFTTTDISTEYRKGCPNVPMRVQILSRNPDMMLIQNFLTPREAEHLVKIASTVVGEKRPDAVDKEYRDSYSAYLKMPTPPFNDDDVVVNCIEQRAAYFQGYTAISNLETLQVVKYVPLYLLTRYHEDGQVQPHFDWLPTTVPSFERSGNRLSSFFVYLLANCTGGTTAFPRVPRPSSSEWCRHLNCDVPWLEVKPKVGTAIFWYNLNSTGVDMKTLHAGSRVVSGTKIGLNIWTRERIWRL